MEEGASARLKKKKHHVYMLECADGSLYTGYALDVDERFRKHQLGKASKYTRAKKAVKIVYREAHRSKSLALKRETAIKRMSRDQKNELLKKNRQL